MTDTFEADIQGFIGKLQANSEAGFMRVADEVERSIRYGSPVSGAPGQPVDTGFLRNSWQRVHPAKFQAEIFTNTAYAPVIETGVRGDFVKEGEMPPPRKLVSAGGTPRRKSTVGGPHSLKLTIAAWQRFVDYFAGERLSD